MRTYITAQITYPKLWSKKITQRRLNWFGKVMNFPENVPAKKALRYCMSGYARPPGRPKRTWISRVKTNVNNMNITWGEAENMVTENLSKWLNIVNIVDIYVGDF